MNRIPSRILLSGLWIFLGSGTLLLFLILGFFNVPASDDYSYARWMREWGFADANITIYIGWGGRYFSNILLTLCNGLSYSTNYKEFLLPYQFHSVGHIFLCTFSTLILFRRFRFLPNVFLALVPLTLFIQKASLISEYFFWLAGTVTYCSGFIFGAGALSAYLDMVRNPERGHIPLKKTINILGVLIFLGSLLVLFKGYRPVIDFLNNQPLVFLFVFGASILIVLGYLWKAGNPEFRGKPIWHWVTMLFCMAGCAGSSELSGAILILTMGFVWLWYWEPSRLFDPVRFFPLILAAMALALCVFTPATLNRQGTVKNDVLHNWAQSLGMGRIIIFQLAYLVSVLPVGLGISLLFPPTAKSTHIPQVSFVKSIGFLVGFLLTIGFLLPIAVCYQSGELPPRAINAIIQVMTYALFGFSFYWGRLLLASRFSMKPGLVAGIQLVLILLVLWDPTRNNLRAGFSDLQSGEAASFLSQYKTEQETILACPTKSCEVQWNTAHPKTLCTAPNPVILGKEFGSLKEYKSYSYAQFYGKNFIYLRPEKEPVR